MTERPATQRQKEYARSLGIDLPPDASVSYASSLISRHFSGPPQPILVEYAEAFGIALPAPSIRTDASVEQAIRDDAGREEYELIAHVWWVASVAADRSCASFNLELLADAHPPAVCAASAFSSDARAVQSFNRIIRPSQPPPLRRWEFAGELNGRHQSRRTWAYITAKNLLIAETQQTPAPPAESRLARTLRRIFR